MSKSFNLFLIGLTFLLFLISCSVQKREKVKENLQKKHINFDSSEIKDFTDKLYISEGHFECKKGFNSTSRFESTSDGNYYNFIYISNDGKVNFFGSPSKISKSKIEKSGDYNAMIYSKNNKFFIDRVYCNYPILGIEMGCQISKSEVQFIDKRILVKAKTDYEHCEIYKLNN